MKTCLTLITPTSGQCGPKLFFFHENVIVYFELMAGEEGRSDVIVYYLFKELQMVLINI